MRPDRGSAGDGEKLRDSLKCSQGKHTLFPGASHSGITITAALLLGLSREGASRFSFLLFIPVILLAGGHPPHRHAALVGYRLVLGIVLIFVFGGFGGGA